jgi:hypothetical protein
MIKIRRKYFVKMSPSSLVELKFFDNINSLCFVGCVRFFEALGRIKSPI